MLLSLALATAIVTATPGFEGKQPQGAINGRRAAVAFGAANAVYVAISNDGGETFGRPVRVAEAKSLARAIAERSAAAIRNAKRLLNEAPALSPAEAMETTVSVSLLPLSRWSSRAPWSTRT